MSIGKADFFLSTCAVLLQSRRRQTGTAESQGDTDQGEITEDSLNRVLAELIGDGTLVLGDEDEDDPDYELVEEDEDEDEDVDMEEYEDDDEDTNGHGYHQLPSIPGKWHEEVKEPKPEGLALLYSGEFGRLRHQIRSRNKEGDVSKLFLNRGSRIRPPVREDFTAVSLDCSSGVECKY